MSAETATIAALYIYPVKGLSPQALTKVQVQQGETLPGDRQFAIEIGRHDFDPIAPKFYPKSKFLQLMDHEKLAAIESDYDAATGILTLKRQAKQVARGNLDQPVGRQLIEQFLAAYLKGELFGTPRLVGAKNHHFCDVPASVVSIINLETVRDIERVVRRPVDPLRFRGNIYIEGLPAWTEFDWLDKTILADGQSALTVIDRTTRCAATNVDPQTAQRDMQIPRTLAEIFGHMDCGVYAQVTTSTQLGVGMPLGPA